MLGISKAYLKKNNLDQAIEYAQIALNMEVNNIETLLYLANLFEKKRDLKSASETLRKLLSIFYFIRNQIRSFRRTD